MKLIVKFIEKFNRTWQEKRFDDLYNFFHKEVVMLSPGKEELVGVEAMVASYKEFLSIGTIHDFKIRDIQVFEFKETAMCHMSFAIDYEIESRHFKEEGVEVYAIDISELSPKIFWRTQLTLNE